MDCAAVVMSGRFFYETGWAFGFMLILSIVMHGIGHQGAASGTGSGRLGLRLDGKRSDAGPARLRRNAPGGLNDEAFGGA